MFKKSQAAMEFLMTYGWAILVVLVAIGALAYFGVLSPDRFLPSKCQLPSGIACVDHRADATGVQVVLLNGMGFDATSVVVSVGQCGLMSPSAGGDNILQNGEQETFTATCTLTPGSKFSQSFGVSYTNQNTGLPHSLNGTVTVSVS